MIRKIIISLAIPLIIGCSQSSPIEDFSNNTSTPPPKMVGVEVNLKDGDSIFIVDLNSTLPDTILKTSSRKSNIYMLDRGYFEVKVKNSEEKTISLSLIRDNDTIYKFNSGGPTSGCLIQLFNR